VDHAGIQIEILELVPSRGPVQDGYSDDDVGGVGIGAALGDLEMLL